MLESGFSPGQSYSKLFTSVQEPNACILRVKVIYVRCRLDQVLPVLHFTHGSGPHPRTIFISLFFTLPDVNKHYQNQYIYQERPMATAGNARVRPLYKWATYHWSLIAPVSSAWNIREKSAVRIAFLIVNRRWNPITWLIQRWDSEDLGMDPVFMPN